VVVVLVFWWAAGLWLGRSPDPIAYREMCAQAAQAALDSVVTTRLTGEAQVRGDVWGTYATAMDDDGGVMVNSAASQVAGSVPPDGESVRLRDELVPLVAMADRTVAEVVIAKDSGDTAALREKLAALEPVENDLTAFLERTR
jgi:hypothetical protein